MYTFNSNNFIESLKKGYEAIPVLQGDGAAKVMVADSIKSCGYSPEDVLSFIYGKMAPSIKLSEAEWKQVIETAIKRGDALAKNLKVYKSTLKGKISYEEMFKLAAECSGVNPVLLQQELCLNKMNWAKVVDSLIKSYVDSEETVVVETPAPVETKEEKKEEAKVKKTRKGSIKVSKRDPRCKSIILIKDGVKKEWASFRECEKELGFGFGTASQLNSGKLKQSKGWVLFKEEEDTPMESKKRSKSKGVIQMKKDKDGNLVVVNTYGSLTEAAKATGVSHSGISKTCSGTYQSAGGYVWKHAEAAA